MQRATGCCQLRENGSPALICLALYSRFNWSGSANSARPSATATATALPPANAACLAAPAYRSIRLPRCDGVCPDAGFSAEVTGVESVDSVERTGGVESTAEQKARCTVRSAGESASRMELALRSGEPGDLLRE